MNIDELLAESDSDGDEGAVDVNALLACDSDEEEAVGEQPAARTHLASTAASSSSAAPNKTAEQHLVSAVRVLEPTFTVVSAPAPLPSVRLPAPPVRAPAAPPVDTAWARPPSICTLYFSVSYLSLLALCLRRFEHN